MTFIDASRWFLISPFTLITILFCVLTSCILQLTVAMHLMVLLVAKMSIATTNTKQLFCHLMIFFLDQTFQTTFRAELECGSPQFIFSLAGLPRAPLRRADQKSRLFPCFAPQIFHDVAYKAKDRNDLVAGIDEFLDQVTVLPPGEWDPSIRIEPPKNVPSQVNHLRDEQKSYTTLFLHPLRCNGSTLTICISVACRRTAC